MSGGGSPCRPSCCARLPSAPHPPSSALLGGWVLLGSVLELSWTVLYGSNLWSVPQEIKEKAGILLPCLSGAPCWSRVCTFMELKSLWLLGGGTPHIRSRGCGCECCSPRRSLQGACWVCVWWFDAAERVPPRVRVRVLGCGWSRQHLHGWCSEDLSNTCPASPQAKPVLPTGLESPQAAL